MKNIFIFLLILVVALFAVKNVVAKMVLSGGVKVITGLGVDIGRIDVGIRKTDLDVRNLKILNPPGFPDEVMADFPELYIDYDLGAFFKGKVHLEVVKLHLKEFTVVKNESGELNVNSLAIQTKKGEEKAPPEKPGEKKSQKIQIDFLDLKVEKVIYKDYSSHPVSIREFDVDIHEQYENITDPQALGRLIVTRALIRTAISRLADLNLEDIQIQITDTVIKYTGKITDAAKSTGAMAEGVAGAAKDITGGAKEVAKETVDTLKKIFPFGGE